MTLLAPWAIWFSLVGATVIALYILKIRRHQTPVPAIEFWRRLTSQTQARSLFQRLKRWLSLLLWLMIVALLVLAVGNPVFSLGKIQPRSIAVIVDNSASMQAVEDASTPTSRLELARSALDDLLSRRPVNDEWMLIEAAHEPRVLESWTRNRRAVLDAAASIKPGVGSSELAVAMKLAAQLQVGKERPCTVIISDRTSAEVGEKIRQNDSLIHWPIGKSDDNLGITRLRIRVNRLQATHHAYMVVRNASSEKRVSCAVLEIDGSTVSVEPFEVEGGEVWEQTIVLNSPQGGILRAWIDRDDILEADDEVYAVLPPIEPASVLLVTSPSEAFFFEQALLAMETLVDPESSRTLTPEEFAGLDQRKLTSDVLVFNNVAPDALPSSCRCICINAWPTAVPARVVGDIEGPRVSFSDRRHPLTRHLNLSAATVLSARKVDLLERATVLAQAEDGSPLIFLFQQPGRDFLCVAFDVMETDLPFRNAFPMLLRNAVAHMSGDSKRWVRDQYAIGDEITPLRAVPPDLKRISVARHTRQGSAEDKSLDVEAGLFSFRDTLQPGLLRFSIGDDLVYAAVNLTNDKETNLAPLKPDQDLERQLALSGRLIGTMPWLALAFCATLLVGLEWMTFHIRWTE